jgi:hypothetical protein
LPYWRRQPVYRYSPLRFLREKLGKIQKPQRPLRKSQRKCSFADLCTLRKLCLPFADLYSEGLVQEEAGYGQAGVENFETS